MTNPIRHSEGTGQINASELAQFGEGSILEPGVLVFHPQQIAIGNSVYIGHGTILKGYHKNFLRIGNGTWIGQNCYFHSAGNLDIGNNVGVGPGVKIITSFHSEEGIAKPIVYSKLKFAPVVIMDDADIGVGAIILPGVTIGRGVQIGAGAVVVEDVPDYQVAAGVPARQIRSRLLNSSKE